MRRWGWLNKMSGLFGIRRAYIENGARMKILEVSWLARLEVFASQMLKVPIQVKRGMLLRVEHGDGLVGLKTPVADV